MNQELIVKPTLEDVLNTNISRRSFLKAAGLASLAPLAESCATAFVGGGTTTYESDNFRFYLPNDLSKAAVDYIIEEHELGLKKLEEFLRVEKDYGRKLGGKLILHIGSGEPDRAWLVGAKAGTTTLSRGFVGAGTIRSDRSPYIHELTHQVVRKAGDFFSEGLAEYTQQKLGRNPAPVTWGVDLHRKIADTELAPLSRYMGLTALNRELGDEAAKAYLQAGSFVKYLIEDVSKGDTKPFMKFFLVDGDYKRNFGKSLEELEEGWRDKIKNTKPLYALSDALKVEHLNPRLQPSGELDPVTKRVVENNLRRTTVGGGYFYPIYVDVRFQSNSEHVIELVNFYIDNVWFGERIGGAGDYRIWMTTPSALQWRLRRLGNNIKPYQSRIVQDFPIPTGSNYPGTEFVVHYGHKIPKVSNEEFDALVRMKKI